jgi:hypothetical protein
MYDLQGPTKKHTDLCILKYTLLLHKSYKPYTLNQNQNSYAPTNIERELHIIQSHQQTSILQELLPLNAGILKRWKPLFILLPNNNISGSRGKSQRSSTHE